MSTDDRIERLRAAFEAMVPEFGAPCRSRIDHDYDLNLRVSTHRNKNETEIHPVFLFSHHFRSFDNRERGYTDNPYRGDHLSIPAYIGIAEEIAIFETSFHKGAAFVEVITFPEADLESPLYRAALGILEAEETR